MKIGIGCDHAGLELKLELISLLKEMGMDCIDYGTDAPKSVDYPDFGEKVSSAVSSGGIARGILICGTGIGMSIVANKFPRIRASLCNDLFTAKMSRLHNDANILVIGGRIVGKDLAKEIVRVWFTTSFEAGRHLNRLNKILHIEEKIKGSGHGTGTSQTR
ncbi:MAG: ribose 5-phosphate isomerase B [Nitrospirae bacterium]|nr:ribose 5-phosphate isomerase B [Nitrospirota bacterium]MCL5421613.1 ribose 5-phosphate isomerase B [Nitrospirota bacterium]